MVKNLSFGTGRRKTSVARVFLREGTGTVTINSKPLEKYFTVQEEAGIVLAPFVVTANEGKYDLYVNVYGGGVHSQAEAIRHGLARALVSYDAANQASLKANGFLTRDSRMVERKKYGQRGARRKFQFSKR